jgi:SAM-dependent methyltransferase
MSPDDKSASWDAEYASGRYRDEPPVDFVADILAAARDAELIGADGLYIGCGNGRNYLPLIAGGLDLVGLDVSAVALHQLAQRAPERLHRLVHGDLDALPYGKTYSIVIGIQVFQHGNRVRAHAHIKSAQDRVADQGLFCLRVNAVGTDVAPEHEVIEQHRDGEFTVRYLAGPKEDLQIHFFSSEELSKLFEAEFEPVLPLRLDRTWRTPQGRGQWSQWEAIWRKV